MNSLRLILKRGASTFAIAALLVAVVAPAALVRADALNPLTERSLLLSSSAPGFQNTDGSGNSSVAPNAIGDNYAPAGSGPNGMKTGETFSFKVSTDSVTTSRSVKAMTFQYCTTAAGHCQAPGNNTGDERDSDRETNAVAWPNNRSDLNVNYTSPVAGDDFIVMMDGSDVSSGWTMSQSNNEDLSHSGALTGKNNYITLTHSSGIAPEFNDQIQVIFKAKDTNYITNPGADAFFVKINTYDSDTPVDIVPGGTHNIDGGVTVANVMTDSIHITTKVLETMAFSVGTKNRDTVVVKCTDEGPPKVPTGCETENAVHGTCDAMQVINANRLNLGNPDAEYSLETGKAWDVNSYWRLSSNSSGGASVYYSGDTLRNTVGDHIAEIGGTKASSTRGTEQFGLAFADAGTDTFDPAFTGLISSEPLRYRTPSLTSDSLAPQANYTDGVGNINNGEAPETAGADAAFAFKSSSNLVPEVIATNNTNVISCATAKMRYIGNIAADTPAGVYTTKINYLAAPQY